MKSRELANEALAFLSEGRTTGGPEAFQVSPGFSSFWMEGIPNRPVTTSTLIR